MARRKTPPTRRILQRRRDAWAAAAEFRGHGRIFSRSACLQIVAELDRELAEYDDAAMRPARNYIMRKPRPRKEENHP